jgi:hypothetical protein
MAGSAGALAHRSVLNTILTTVRKYRSRFALSAGEGARVPSISSLIIWSLLICAVDAS